MVDYGTYVRMYDVAVCPQIVIHSYVRIPLLMFRYTVYCKSFEVEKFHSFRGSIGNRAVK